MIIKIPTPEEMILKMAIQPNNYTAIYARKSNLSSNGCSIETQLDLAKKYALEHDLLVFKEYSEVLSAVKNDIHSRIALDNLLKDAASGKFKHLILYRRDRLARTSRDFLILKKKFRKFGVKLHYTADTSVPDDSPLSDFIDNILMAVSELEPNNIALRTATGRKAKREGGFYEAKSAPFGFIKQKINIESKERSYFYVNNTYTDMISTIFEAYVSKDEITNFSELRNNLIKNNTNINDISTTQIEKLILHPICCGKMFINPAYKFINGALIDTSTNDVIEFNFNHFIDCKNVDPIIDENFWFTAICKYLSVTKNKNKNNLRTPQKDLFKGKIFCNNCSSLLHKTNNSYKCNSCTCSVSCTKVFNTLNSFLKVNLLDCSRLTNYIKACKSNINFTLKSTKNKLKNNISFQTKCVDSYLTDTNNKYLCTKLIILKEKETELRELLIELEHKVKTLSMLDAYKTEEILQNQLDTNPTFIKTIIDTTIEKVIINEDESVNLHSNERSPINSCCIRKGIFYKTKGPGSLLR